VSVQDIAARRMTDGFRALLAQEVTRARHLFANSAILDDVLDSAVRPGVRLARSMYERVLDRVEALGFDVLRHRVRVPPWQLGAVAMAALPTTGARERDPLGLDARR
jgi:phytoene synthase